MSFVWFWTFWHWSKESFRDGRLLRSPLHGIGSHWDEWFRHEASESETRGIGTAGQSERSQRRFIGWLLRHWAAETGTRRDGLARHFVLGQLAHVQPFDRWKAFDTYRRNYGVAGVQAIVLAEHSAGESNDVRPVEGLLLPADSTAPANVAEGFFAEATDLDTPRRAARSLLHGSGFFRLLGWWLACGRRPYPRWLGTMLTLGWAVLGGMIVYLLVGPDPGRELVQVATVLTVVWSGLVVTALGVAVMVGFLAWRQGRAWAARLDASQLRLRMNGGLTLRGGSAGLAFCLNILNSIRRTDPRAARRSWLWRQLFSALGSEAEQWAATGVVTADGALMPVVLRPKLRACLLHGGIRHLLTPRQPGIGRRALVRAEEPLNHLGAPQPHGLQSVAGAQLGFAAERPPLVIHRSGHVAEAIMRIGGLINARQLAVNTFAIVVSCAMLLALPDLRGILLPPGAPAAVAPSSPSPYHLWVSLDTDHPEYFQVALESRYWSNRRAEVAAHRGANASIRAEMRLQRIAIPTSSNEEDGIVWIERRHRFLTREFSPGQRIGRYTFAYLNRLGYE